MNLSNPITEWENDIWTPEPLFQGETVFCLASGPSLTQEICDKVKGRKAIVVNSSCLLAPWADVLFFTDSGWYDGRFEDGSRRAHFVNAWPGLVVSFSRQAKRELDHPNIGRTTPRILRVKACGAPTAPPHTSSYKVGFPPVGSREIYVGRTSGHTAVSLAVAMGAKRVCLLGYDMQLVAGREHHHKDYTGPRDVSIYANEFVPSFNGWNASALASGVEVLNCTPGSAVQEFPFADLDEVLS
jgi:hypothetical protein